MNKSFTTAPPEPFSNVEELKKQTGKTSFRNSTKSLKEMNTNFTFGDAEINRENKRDRNLSNILKLVDSFFKKLRVLLLLHYLMQGLV